MIKFIDNFLNKTTMYRLVLYVLVFFLVAAFVLSFFNLLPYTPADLLGSTIIILAASWITNVVFSKVFEAAANIESVYITALILVFIITPPQAGDYSQFLSLAIWASLWAMASKYMVAIRKKHIFNPAAFAVALTALSINEAASWWIGTLYMLPFVLVGGMLIVRKIRRADMVWSFLVVALTTTVIGFMVSKGMDPFTSLTKTISDSALFFFAFIMLTEPLTTPPSKWLRVGYGAFVGFLFAPAMHIGTFYSTPELALLVGNIFSFAVSPKEKLVLVLKETVKVAADTYDFIFSNDTKFNFNPGQYMEWTLPHRDPDSRGNRRYFTIASSPTENEVHLGVKFYPEPSSFKNKLAFMKPGETIVASSRAGDFVLPQKKDEKLVFIAGGIGVTPFRSMIKYLIDTKEKRSITLLYSNKAVADVAYKEVFDQAEAELGIKVVHVITNPGDIPDGWRTRTGFIDGKMIAEEIPDYKDRTFYISGPHSMVSAFEATLKNMGVSGSRIKIDFFPGFV